MAELNKLNISVFHENTSGIFRKDIIWMSLSRHSSRDFIEESQLIGIG